MGYNEHSLYCRPSLSKFNKIKRLEFALNRVIEPSTGVFQFLDISNKLFIDEKWFDLFDKTEKITKRCDEIDPPFPSRTCLNKSQIEKAMFITAVGKPQVNDDGSYFNGKVVRRTDQKARWN